VCVEKKECLFCWLMWSSPKQTALSGFIYRLFVFLSIFGLSWGVFYWFLFRLKGGSSVNIPLFFFLVFSGPCSLYFVPFGVQYCISSWLNKGNFRWWVVAIQGSTMTRLLPKSLLVVWPGRHRETPWGVILNSLERSWRLLLSQIRIQGDPRDMAL